MTSIKRTTLAMLLLAVVAMLLPTQPVAADNTKQAQSVVVCSYSYHGTTYSQSLYVLDAPSKTDRADREKWEQYHALWNVAGIYNHEWIDWPNYPTTVVPADLKDWHCKWSLGNTPSP